MLPLVMALVALVAIYVVHTLVRRPRAHAPAPDLEPDAPAPRPRLGLGPVLTAGLLTGGGLLAVSRASAATGIARVSSLIAGGLLLALGLGLLMVVTASARRR